jgi:hypothetical protein
MKLAPVWFALVLPWLAVDAADRRERPSASWREAIVAEAVQEFQKQRGMEAPAPSEPEPEPVSPFVREPVDPEVVVLEPLTVTEQFDVKRFELAMGREHGRSPGTKRRWGTGAYTRDIGKVRVQVLSILHVPVMFGLSW